MSRIVDLVFWHAPPATVYSYDAVGNLLSLTDPVGNSTVYTYDALNRVKTDTNELGYARSYEYDANGNRTKYTDRRGLVSTYQYDKRNRLITETWVGSGTGPSGADATITSSYNNVNDLKALVDTALGGTSLNMGHDELGRQTAAYAIDGDDPYPGTDDPLLLYFYDALGQRTGTVINDLNSTDQINAYSFDALGRVKSITQSGAGAQDKRADFSYYTDGRTKEVLRYEATSTTNRATRSEYFYDDLGRLKQLKHTGEADTNVINDYLFTHFDNGWLKTMNFTDVVGRAGGAKDTVTFGYDRNGQVTSALYDQTDHPLYRSGAGETFGFDENGNRTSSWKHGTGYSHDPTPTDGTGYDNRLDRNGTNKYLYDHQGNLIEVQDQATSAKGSRSFQSHS